jgi:hypothetical protein
VTNQSAHSTKITNQFQSRQLLKRGLSVLKLHVKSCRLEKLVEHKKIELRLKINSWLGI